MTNPIFIVIFKKLCSYFLQLYCHQNTGNTSPKQLIQVEIVELLLSLLELQKLLKRNSLTSQQPYLVELLLDIHPIRPKVMSQNSIVHPVEFCTCPKIALCTLYNSTYISQNSFFTPCRILTSPKIVFYTLYNSTHVPKQLCTPCRILTCPKIVFIVHPVEF